MIGYSSICISQSTIGTYTCQVAVKGYQSIQRTAQVYQKWILKILKTPESSVQYGPLGETVQLVCESFAIPVPEGIVWKYNDYPVNSKTEHYQVITQRKKDGLVSTLVIKDSVYSDYGTYNCSLRNDYGQDFHLVELQRQRKSICKKPRTKCISYRSLPPTCCSSWCCFWSNIKCSLSDGFSSLDKTEAEVLCWP